MPLPERRMSAVSLSLLLLAAAVVEVAAVAAGFGWTMADVVGSSAKSASRSSPKIASLERRSVADMSWTVWSSCRGQRRALRCCCCVVLSCVCRRHGESLLSCPHEASEHDFFAL